MQNRDKYITETIVNSLHYVLKIYINVFVNKQLLTFSVTIMYKQRIKKEAALSSQLRNHTINIG